MLVLLILMTGCNFDLENSIVEIHTPSDFRVAILLAGPIDDHSWNQSGYEGLKLVEQAFKANVSYKESVTATTALATARAYAQQGYDLVILHGGEYVEAASIVAKEFPRTKFAINGFYAGNNSNLGAITFRFGEAGYLAGLLAAQRSKTGHIAYIIGFDYPQYVEEAKFFEKGAQSINPNIKLSIKFLQTWIDANKAPQTALELIQQGADVISINADAPGVKAIKAITQYPNVSILGRDIDQYNLAPSQILTSVITDNPSMILKAATLVQQGRWEGKQYKFGLREEMLKFAPFRNSLTAQQEALFNKTCDDIRSGKLDTTFDFEDENKNTKTE